MDIEHSTLAIEVENILQVLNLLLEFHHQSIIGCAHSVGLDLHHDLPCSISKFKGTNSFTNAIGLGVAGCDKACLGVTSKRIL